MGNQLNKAKCLNCNDIIESTHRHDFVACSCYQSSNVQCHLISEQLITALGNTVVLDDNQKHQIRCVVATVLSTGFFLDGGTDYLRAGGNFSHLEYIQE